MTKLAKKRKESGLTQAQLADLSGVNVRMIQHYEQGKKDINTAAAQTVLKLSKALNCGIEDLLEMDVTTHIYKDVFGIDEDHENINSYVKAVVINFNDGKGDIIVENDNFGTKKKNADFTEGKKKAGLHPLQIVFSGLSIAKICHERYVDKDGNIREF